MTHRSDTSRLISIVVLAAAAAALAGCASSGGERRFADEPSQRYLDENPSAFDSDVYYDPFYHYRGTGEFRAERKLKPY